MISSLKIRVKFLRYRNKTYINYKNKMAMRHILDVKNLLADLKSKKFIKHHEKDLLKKEEKKNL